METQPIQHTGCCDPFDPAPWQDKEVVWQNKLFLKDRYASFLHIPLNFGKKMIKDMDLIIKAGAKSSQQMMLCDESLWGADIYIEVSKDVPGAQMTTMSGIFLTKVFEGPYSNCGKWAKEMESYVKSKNREIKKLYFSYTTCPSCAKAYGKNYVVLFAQTG